MSKKVAKYTQAEFELLKHYSSKVDKSTAQRRARGTLENIARKVAQAKRGVKLMDESIMCIHDAAFPCEICKRCRVRHKRIIGRKLTDEEFAALYSATMEAAKALAKKEWKSWDERRAKLDKPVKPNVTG